MKKIFDDWLIQLNDKVRGSLIGGAAGDALGYAIEFVDEEYIFQEYGSSGITEYELSAGKALISDDTQMTLFTAAGLMTGLSGLHGDDPQRSIYLSYLDWLHTQFPEDVPEYPNLTWLADESALYYRRAPGRTCLNALESGKMGTIGFRINNSKGCGGVMRVAPIGLLLGVSDNNYQEHIELAAEAAAITHGHDLGFLPAAMLADLAGRLSRDSDLSIADAVAKAMEDVKTVFQELEYTEDFLNLIQLAVELSKENLDDLDAIHELGQGWVGDEALAIAVYCSLKYPEDIEAALIASVNHEGDSDSTGAITGNIVGAHIGFSKIPEKFIRNLELKDLILEVADDMTLEYYGKQDNDQYSRKFAKKYLRQ